MYSSVMSQWAAAGNGHSRKNSTAAAHLPSKSIVGAYVLFGSSASLMWHLVAEGEFSALLTLAGMVQTLAVCLLIVQVVSCGGATGVSARALELDAVSLVFRLANTVWLNGYLPVDATGDWICQTVDAIALSGVVGLLYQIKQKYRHSHQEEHDTFSVPLAVCGALILAGLFHADMNNRPVFDTLWMASQFLAVVGLFPQIWLIMRTGGKVEALTSHYIAAMALGRLLNGSFMWFARHDVTCNPWFADVNHAVYAILCAQLVQVVVLSDFAFVYIKAVATQGLRCTLDLDEGAGMFV